jgi:hypothetical protein
MECFGIQNETQEKVPTYYRKHMIQNTSFAVRMMKANFDNGVEAIIPDNPLRKNFMRFMVKRKRY